MNVDDADLSRRLRAWTLQDDALPAGEAPNAETPNLADYTGRAEKRPPHRTWIGRAAVLVPLLAVAGAAVVFSANREGEGKPTATLAPPASVRDLSAWWRVGPCDGPQIGRQDMTEAELAAAQKASDDGRAEEDRTGYHKAYSKLPDGTYYCGYGRSLGNVDEVNAVGAPPWGNPMYDAPKGKVIGYTFTDLGFVPIEIATAPGFDPGALRIQLFGCDPVTNEACSTDSTVPQPGK